MMEEPEYVNDSISVPCVVPCKAWQWKILCLPLPQVTCIV